MSHKDTMSLYITNCNYFKHFMPSSASLLLFENNIEKTSNYEDKTRIIKKSFVSNKKRIRNHRRLAHLLLTIMCKQFLNRGIQDEQVI